MKFIEKSYAYRLSLPLSKLINHFINRMNLFIGAMKDFIVSNWILRINNIQDLNCYKKKVHVPESNYLILKTIIGWCGSWTELWTLYNPFWPQQLEYHSVGRKYYINRILDDVCGFPNFLNKTTNSIEISMSTIPHMHVHIADCSVQHTVTRIPYLRSTALNSFTDLPFLN